MRDDDEEYDLRFSTASITKASPYPVGSSEQDAMTDADRRAAERLRRRVIVATDHELVRRAALRYAEQRMEGSDFNNCSPVMRVLIASEIVKAWSAGWNIAALTALAALEEKA